MYISMNLEKVGSHVWSNSPLKFSCWAISSEYHAGRSDAIRQTIHVHANLTMYGLFVEVRHLVGCLVFHRQHDEMAFQIESSVHAALE